MANRFLPSAEPSRSERFIFRGSGVPPPETHTFTGGGHTATYTGNRYGSDINNMALGHLPPQGYSPSEVQTAYGLNAIYGAGLNGVAKQS